jgi:hypothetical protein
MSLKSQDYSGAYPHHHHDEVHVKFIENNHAVLSIHIIQI